MIAHAVSRELNLTVPLPGRNGPMLISVGNLCSECTVISFFDGKKKKKEA